MASLATARSTAPTSSMAIQMAGLAIPYATTSQIHSGKGNGGYYIPSSTGGAPADVELVNAGDGPHSHAILEGQNPGTFYGSNSGRGPIGHGGPQRIPSKGDVSGNPFWGPAVQGGTYYIPCVKNAAPPPSPPSQGGGGGGGAPSVGGGNDWDIFDLFQIMMSSGGYTIIITQGPPKSQ